MQLFHRLLCPAFVAALLLSPVLGFAASGQVRVEIKDPKGTPVADAIASLVSLDAPQKPVPPAEPIFITQVDQEFQPYVTAVPVGARVNFPNRDDVQHHVYSLSKTKAFDIPLFRGESKEIIVFERPGVVTIGCNIHDWMAAHIVVLDTPYFAKSGADGLVPLQGLPAGRYRLEVWHPRIAAVLTRDVTVSAADTTTQVIAVTLLPNRRIRRAPETGGGAYR